MIENSVKSKISNFAKYCKSILYKLLAWNDETDTATRTSLANFDYLNKLMFTSLRGGQKQEYDKPIPKKVRIGNWIVRCAILLTFVRMNLVLLFDECDQLDIYLANPFPGPGQRKSYLLLAYVAFVFFSWLREYSHYIERIGSLINFRIFFNIRQHGIHWKPLKFNKKSSQVFNKVCHIIMTQGARLMVFIWFYALGIAIMIRLHHPSTYSTRVHVIFILCYIPSEIVALATLIDGLVGIGIYLMTLVAFYNAQIEAIRDEITFFLRKHSLSPVELSRINEKVILFMNEIEKTYSRLDYLHLYLMVLNAFLADFMLLFSLIFKLFPDFVASLITFGGVLIHFFLVIGNLWASSYYSKTLIIHGYYTGLILNTRPYCGAQFKALEVQNRINARRTGVQIGNLCLITPLFALIFILENINFIMLLTVNIRTLV